jgi:hypothetical protein
MDQVVCLCNSEPTHRCTSCEERVYVCPKCIPLHLSSFPSDGIIPLKSKQNSQSPLIPCSKCFTNNSIFLEIHENSALPVCKPCKRTLRGDENIYVSIKWKDVVSSSKDISEISLRKKISSQALLEIEKSNNFLETAQYYDKLEASIIQMVNKWIQDKKAGLHQRMLKESEGLKKVKKQVEEQILLRKPDLGTIGGRIINSLITSGVCNIPKRDLNLVPSNEILETIQMIFDSIKFEQEVCEHYVYLFTPGKPTVFRVNLERMSKKEVAFNRNWTFEASWCELENKSIFFCGGNGMNNSEVLVVNFDEKTVVNRSPFTGRSGHFIIEHSNMLYVFGGNKGKVAERYRFDNDTWDLLAEMPYKIMRLSGALISDEIILSGADCEKLFTYNIRENAYKDLSIQDLAKGKNKILFSHQNIIYCLSGDKLLYASYDNIDKWTSVDIIDRDWWTYSKPVVYDNHAYFIKYFVRNLWRLNLTTFELTELILAEIGNEN